MILSFSIPAMRPMIEAGIRQANGEDVGGGRVKRQTIRQLSGPDSPWLRLIDAEKWYRLHLWWKARTKERELLGVLPCKSAEPIIIQRGGGSVSVHVSGRQTEIVPLSWADGFDDAADFLAFFVPAPNDAFDGVLIKW